MASPRPIRLLPRFLLVAVAFELARSTFVNFWNRYVYVPNISQAPNQVIPPEAFQFGASLATFAISPCLLFTAYYLLGKRRSTDNDAKSLVTSLFLGGAIGSVLGIFPVLAAYSGTDLLRYPYLLTRVFGNPWTLATWIVDSLSEGLFNVFAGFSAVFLAARRTVGPAFQSIAE